MKELTLASSLFLFTACIGGSGGGGGGTTYPPPSDIDAAYTTCTTEADCVAVELGCCDECNGGTAWAVNTSSVATVTAEYAEDCSTPVACTEMGCAPWVVSCSDAGVCEMERGEF